MPREEVRSPQRQEVETCDFCGHTRPWHSLICIHAQGLHCPECEALLPRHYPGCSTGERFAFYGWQLARDGQRDVEAIFNEHMRARAARQAAGQ